MAINPISTITADLKTSVFFGSPTGRISRLVIATHPLKEVNGRKETDVVHANITGFELRENRFNATLPAEEKGKKLLYFVCDWEGNKGIEIKCNNQQSIDFIVLNPTRTDFKVQFKVIEASIEGQTRMFTEMQGVS